MAKDIPSTVGSGDAPASPEDAGLYCPACGYDLRGTTADRCSECGSAFDRATLRVSRLPWVHRRELGRIRAWRQTVWLVIRHPKTLAEEMAGPVDWPAASRFRWIMVVLGTAIVAATFAAVYHWWPEGRRVAGPLAGGNPSAWPMAIVLDRWGFGLSLTVGMAAGLAAATWGLRSWFWILGGPARGRSSALSLYMITWIVPLGLLPLYVLSRIAAQLAAGQEELVWEIACLFKIIADLAFLHWWIASLGLLRRTTRRGWLTLGVAALGIPLGALICVFTAWLAVTYTLGFVAIMVRSLW